MKRLRLCNHQKCYLTALFSVFEPAGCLYIIEIRSMARGSSIVLSKAPSVPIRRSLSIHVVARLLNFTTNLRGSTAKCSEKLPLPPEVKGTGRIIIDLLFSDV